MSTWKIIISVLFSLCFVSANVCSEVTTNTSTGQFFKFKFELNKPLVYAIEFKLRTVNDSSGSGRNSLTRKTTGSRYKIKLTAISTNQDGTTTVCYEPFDFEQDVDNVGASGHTTISTRGLNIVSKQNDIVVVDTSKDIGMSQAKNMKLPIYPSLLSGYFDLDPTGNVKKIDGDLPFIDQWQETLKFSLGFFQILFPTNLVSIRDSWTNFVTLQSAGGVTFNSNGIIQPNVFIRELDSSANSTTNAPVACFRLYESDSYQDFGGYIEQFGQRTSIAIPDHTESMNAIFHFDPKLGRLIDMKKTGKTHDSFNMMLQGSSATGNDDSESEYLMTLISP